MNTLKERIEAAARENFIKVNPHIPLKSEEAADVEYFCRKGFSHTYDSHVAGYRAGLQDEIVKELRQAIKMYLGQCADQPCSILGLESCIIKLRKALAAYDSQIAELEKER